MSSHASEPAPGALDPAAYVERLYAEHASLVRSVCRRLLRDRTEADDAVQQTFLAAQRALVNGSSPREPAAWLATIARNECLARVRARMREPLPVDAEATDVGGDAHTAALRRHEVRELRRALADLPDQQRQAILLRELRGLSYEEVAGYLSVTTSAVESLLFRARRNLQTKLREAVAALAPGELFGRILGGGGLAAPAAAKVAAVGTALFAGGAVLQPSLIGLGPAPHARRTSVVTRASAKSVASKAVMTPTAAWVRPSTVWVASSRPATHAAGEGERGDTSSVSGGSRVEAPDRQESTGSGQGDRPSGDGGTTSGVTQETSDTAETQVATSVVTTTVTGSSGDSAGDSSGSGD